MSLIRWDPFSEIDSIFNRMMPSSLGAEPRVALSDDGSPKFEWAPSADISETDREYLIRAELPAVKKEDVNVAVDGGMITIQGERKQQREEKNEKFHRIESVYGSFARSFSLPDNIDSKSIKCESKEGVLTVHIPKTEAAKSKRVEIKVQ
ncbi:MAG TPA: Hsp20/alpha crystallin family protein [Steroidobacteraceae bacterium]|nr:Hsp20/alpha crystallin family protein [Steroidobacteraceae bacterium]